MTTETPLNEEVQSSEPGLFNSESKSSSDILKNARKKKSISVEDVADELNLSASVVRAIESDDWEALPEATYVRGYVRSYASFLGLDVNDVLMNFRYKNSEADLNLDAMPRGVTEPGVTTSVPKFIKWLVVLGAIGGSVYTFFGDDIKLLITDQNLGVALTDDKSVKSRSSQQARDLNASSVVNEEKAQATIQTNTDSPVTADLKEMMQLSFTGISWVDISDKTGRKVVYKSFPPGEKIKVKAIKPLKVFIGNVDAVKMSYEGKEVPLLDFKEEDHAKFTLD